MNTNEEKPLSLDTCSNPITLDQLAMSDSPSPCRVDPLRDALATADSPLVWLTDDLVEVEASLANASADPECSGYYGFSLGDCDDPITRVGQGLQKLFAKEQLQLPKCSQPDEWTLALRNLSIGFPDRFRILTIIGVESIDNFAASDRNQFAKLISHLACESGLSILLVSKTAARPCLELLPGFWHLRHAAPEGLIEVPPNWVAPFEDKEMSTWDSNCVGTKTTQEKLCLRSAMFLGSSIAFAVAIVSIAALVSGRLDSTLAIFAPSYGKIEPSKAARVRVFNVASPTEIEWSRNSTNPRSLYARDQIETGFVFDPIPVSFQAGQDANETEDPNAKTVANNGQLEATSGSMRSYPTLIPSPESIDTEANQRVIEILKFEKLTTDPELMADDIDETLNWDKLEFIDEIEITPLAFPEMIPLDTSSFSLEPEHGDWLQPSQSPEEPRLSDPVFSPAEPRD